MTLIFLYALDFLDGTTVTRLTSYYMWSWANYWVEKFLMTFLSTPSLKSLNSSICNVFPLFQLKFWSVLVIFIWLHYFLQKLVPILVSRAKVYKLIFRTSRQFTLKYFLHKYQTANVKNYIFWWQGNVYLHDY